MGTDQMETLGASAADVAVRRPFRRNIAVLAAGTVFAQGLTVISSPALTRLFAPRDIGILGLMVSFLGIASVAISLRFEAAIVSAADDDDASALVVLSLGLIIPLSLVATLAAVAIHAAALFGFGDLPELALLLIFPALVVTGAFGVVRYWLVRHEKFGSVAALLSMQGIGRAVGQIGFGLLGWGWMGLALGDLLGRAIGASRAVTLARRGASDGRGTRRSSLRTVVGRYRKFPLLSAPSSVVEALTLLLPLPLIAQAYGIEAAGLYALMQRVIAVPSSLVGNSVADAFHGRLAFLVRNRPAQASGFFLRTSLFLTLVASLPALLLWMFGAQVFGVVFGASWREAGELASVAAPLAVAQVTVSPVSRAVYVYEGQEHKFAFDLLRLAAVTAAILLGSAAGLSLVGSVFVLSSTQTGAYAVYFLILWRMVRRGAPRRAAGARAQAG